MRRKTIKLTLAAQDASCLLCRAPWGINKILMPCAVTSPDGERFAVIVCSHCFEKLDLEELRKEERADRRMRQSNGP